MEFYPYRPGEPQFNPEKLGVTGSIESEGTGLERQGFELEQRIVSIEAFAESFPSLDVVAAFISPNKGEPMQSTDAVHAISGIGLEGDRYSTRTGAFSHTKRIPDEDRQVSIISRQGIQAANEELVTKGMQPFTEAETRRNIVVHLDADYLNSLVGKRFTINGIEMEGVELCTPCGRPSKLSGKPDFEPAFQNRGGLRAKIINDGIISVHS